MRVEGIEAQARNLLRKWRQTGGRWCVKKDEDGEDYLGVRRPQERGGSPSDAFAVEAKRLKPVLIALLRLEEAIAQTTEHLEPDGYVYLLQAGPYYKIGRTIDPDNRIKTLAIQLPFSVQLIHVIPCEDHAAGEAYLHKRYSGKRLNGEWFSLEADQVEEIRACEFMLRGVTWLD